MFITEQQLLYPNTVLKIVQKNAKLHYTFRLQLSDLHTDVLTTSKKKDINYLTLFSLLRSP